MLSKQIKKKNKGDNMAIFKMMNIKATNKKTNKGALRLKDSIKYILNPEKTNDGLYVGSNNCFINGEKCYKQMLDTKKYFGKEWGRQGYHFILSLKENEGSPEELMRITDEFIQEYLKDYEVIYAVHNNTDKLHSHIVFNSIDCVRGMKYHNENDEWEKVIMPIINRLCKKYGLSELELDLEKNNKSEDEKINWREQIRRDIDKIILKSKSYDEFILLLRKKGYMVSFGKYLYIKPRGSKIKIKSKTCGELYTVENIKRRIIKINSVIEKYKIIKSPEIKKYNFFKKEKIRKGTYTEYQKCIFKQMIMYKKMSGINLKQSWTSRNEYKKYQRAKENYIFLVENNIHSYEDAQNLIQNKNKEVYEINKRIHESNNDKKMLEPIILIYEEMGKLKSAHDVFLRSGDRKYLNEYLRYNDLEEKLRKRENTYEGVAEYLVSFDEKLKELRDKRSECKKVIRTLDKIYERVTYEKQFSDSIGMENNGEEFVYQDGTMDNATLFSAWSDNRKAGAMELENWLDRRTENLVNEGEYILCSRTKPDRYIKVIVETDEFNGVVYNKRKYYLHKEGESIPNESNGSEYYTDERFEGRPRNYWYNLKRKMIDRLGDGSDYIMFKNEENYQKYMESYQKQKDKQYCYEENEKVKR